jgi:radical SAM superfamily enzyme YgiQ (UPF0313 family)
LSLGNYEHQELSPVRSGDLIRAARHPEENLFFPYFSNRLTGLIAEREPSIVGFSLNYLSQALCTFAMIGFLKREFSRIKVILGGGLVTSWTRRPGWQNSFEALVDHLVAGPGEGALLSLMGVNPSEAGNHGYLPDYESLPLQDYLSPGPILPYSCSSGCYWNRCSFCPEKAEGNPFIPVPAGHVVRDLHELVDRRKPVLIHLLDNAISPSLMEAIAEHPPGVPWYGFARVTRHLTDLDFCVALKQSGCAMLKLGVESGDQFVLDYLEKGIDLADVSAILKNLKNAGVATYVYLLFGTPPEGQEEARKTVDFIASHHDCIGFLNLAIFNMPIHGPEGRESKTRSFYEGDLSLYTDFDHPKGWTRSKIRQFLDKELRRHPAIAPILRRDPPVFTSNHAPFFVMAGR